MLTDDEILVGRHEELPALVCLQKRANKKYVTEDDLASSNVSSFGDDIGRVTNRVTSMYEVMSHFEKDSKEYEELRYRIRTGQNYQQNCIM